jgi:hypothetical protein
VLFSAQGLDALPAGCRRAVALDHGHLALDARGEQAALRQAWAERLEGKEPAAVEAEDAEEAEEGEGPA